MGQIFQRAFDLKGVNPRTAREVLLVLADHADERTHQAWPSVERIAVAISLDGARAQSGEPRKTRTVQRTLAALRACGVIVATRKPGFRRPTKYWIDLSRLPLKGDIQVSPVRESKIDMRVAPTKGDKNPKEGDIRGSEGDTKASPEPPREPIDEPSTRPNESLTDDGLSHLELCQRAYEDNPTRATLEELRVARRVAQDDGYTHYPRVVARSRKTRL